jgi:hypothetical protein
VLVLLVPVQVEQCACHFKLGIILRDPKAVVFVLTGEILPVVPQIPQPYCMNAFETRQSGGKPRTWVILARESYITAK